MNRCQDVPTKAATIKTTAVVKCIETKTPEIVLDQEINTILVLMIEEMEDLMVQENSSR